MTIRETRPATNRKDIVRAYMLGPVLILAMTGLLRCDTRCNRLKTEEVLVSK